MSDTVRFDVSALADLAQDLRGAGASLARQVPAIIKRGAQNIKDDARARITAQIRRIYLPWYPAAISYDVTVSGSQVVAEVGPDKSKRQGGMGPGIENGSANHPPLPHLNPSLDAEAPKTEQQLLTAAVKTMLK